MKTYSVAYKMKEEDEKWQEIDVPAASKEDAHSLAWFNVIPKKEGTYPAEIVIQSVTYGNGKKVQLSKFIGQFMTTKNEK